MRGRSARPDGQRRGRRGLLATLVSAGMMLTVVTVSSQAARAADPPPPPPGCGGRTSRTPAVTPPSSNVGKDWVYTCTFSDDFNGSSLDSSKWTPQVTYPNLYSSGPDACYVNSPNNISVADGSLTLTARKEAAPFACPGLPDKNVWNDNDPSTQVPSANSVTQYTSGSLTSTGKFSQAYGRFEIRAKLPAVTGVGNQFSWWLWPENAKRYGPQHWSSGELDVMEWYSQFQNLGIPFIHYIGNGSDPNKTKNSCNIGNPSDWHTYAMEWEPNSISFIYDGTVCLTDTNWTPTNTDPSTGQQLAMPQPFDQPFNLNLTEALGVATNKFDPSSTPLPAATQIDYVYAWQGQLQDRLTNQVSSGVSTAQRLATISYSQLVASYNLTSTKIRCVVTVCNTATDG